ncbi:MAG: XrtA system polysaccharide deacetylase [Candidatus Latescibacterota bacterium]
MRRPGEARPTSAAAPLNAFTVDLEDWYQGLEIDAACWHGFEHRLEVGTLRLLDLLREAGVRATFFVLGLAAQQAPDLVREIQRHGHEIGTHGHAHRFVYRLGPEGFHADLCRSLEVLAPLVAAPVRGHRAPFFSITRQTPWAFEVLHRQGIRYDSSVFPVRNYRYGIPGATRWIHPRAEGLMEFPPSTVRLLGQNVPVGGGAYFRLFPYSMTTRALRTVTAAGHPAAFYVHPWELDPAQPRLDLPRRIGLTHYWNLGCTAGRLRRLLCDLPFGTMSAALEAHGPPASPRSDE